MNYREIFNFIDEDYCTGTKITLKDLKLLREIYRGCNPIYSDGILYTLCLMSINNHHIPKKIRICEIDKFDFDAYLKLKQKDVVFGEDLRNIMDCQKYAGETLHHFNMLYFLGIDYEKITEYIYLNLSKISVSFSLYFSLPISSLAEGFLKQELGEQDLNILLKYNPNIGNLFKENYSLFLDNGINCSRVLGLPNSFMRYFLSCFKALSIVYLTNIERYHHNPKIVGEATMKIKNNDILVNPMLLNNVSSEEGYQEAKRILDSILEKSTNEDISIEKKLLSKNMI